MLQELYAKNVQPEQSFSEQEGKELHQAIPALKKKPESKYNMAVGKMPASVAARRLLATADLGENWSL